MDVQLELIKQRKYLYGNNFPNIAQLWTEFLGVQNPDVKISPQDVVFMMAKMKDTRIDAVTRLSIIEMKKPHEKLDMNYMVDLNISLIDSIKDRNAYIWIGMNYEEYLAL